MQHLRSVLAEERGADDDLRVLVDDQGGLAGTAVGVQQCPDDVADSDLDAE